MESRSLFEELRRRKVIRVSAAYLAVGLGVIYAADAILPRLALPDWTVTLVIILVGLGFPLAIVLSWAFDVTPRGVVRAEESAPTASVATAPPPAESGSAARETAVKSGARRAPDAAPGTARPGIVVLPFDDMSPDADSEHLSDGLTEEITADLAGIRALRVISRTSAMRFKSSEHDLPSIGRELGVRYALEGSVRRAGARLRITAQLIDAESDEHLWAGKFDGSVDDVFELQERVAREICGALDVTLTPEEDRRLADRPIEDPRAFELFVRARQRLRRYSTEGVAELLARAVEIEGETPPLRALMAWAKVNEVRSGMNRDMRPLAEAEREARELLETAPDGNYGHALLGYIAYERGDQPAAVRHFKAALEIEPNDADSLFYLGIAHNAADRPRAALDAAERLHAVDPLSPFAHILRAIPLWFAGRPEDGMPAFERAVELDPDNFIVRWTAGYACALIGRVAGADAQARWLRENAPSMPYTHQLTALVQAIEGDAERALARLEAIDLEPLDAHNTFHVAEPLALAGDLDRALALVDRAVDGGFYPYAFLAEHCPFMEPLRGRPEYEAILEKARARVAEFGAA